MDQFISGSKKAYKGSLSLEAALVLPVFLFFILTLFLGIEAVRFQSNILEGLNEGLGKIYAGGSDGKEAVLPYLDTQRLPYHCVDGGRGGILLQDHSTVDSDGIIELSASYGIRPAADFMPTGNIRIRDRVVGHAFTGYTGGFGTEHDPEEDEYVYITETGTKYHRSTECTHIRITPAAVDASYIESGRNRRGAKYYPCERCRPALSGLLFITPEGSRYHCDSNCSALKRTVWALPLKEAVSRGYTPCSKCG